MSERPSSPRPGAGGVLVAIGVMALAVGCCAGPALIAGGGLALAGGVLSNPVVLAIGALVLVGAVVYTVSRRTRARASTGISKSDVQSAARESGMSTAGDCCVPRAATTTPVSRKSESDA
jgi:mercuric ion transport protein